ncbi:MAG TPA: methylmalonyl Co-A mutase-associated GTPase MeaB [Chitinophagaceae bacterium]|nr:methylmalonyl Co-A mutase-associated GTPase MeaB [Chitinophagaceae bacterium]
MSNYQLSIINYQLPRAISIVENEVEGFEDLLRSLPSSPKEIPVIGITGPPGAGKSTLVDGLIDALVNKGKTVGVLCVDPSSPFNLGALLGDRVRMNNWYNHPNVFIRSLASRGSLGGLNPKIIEITDVMKAANFDYILIETVGVGQSEIEIAGLADVTVVVVVPEGGDEIQTMKAGLMEIADIFVVNKSDRPDAAKFVKNLQLMLAPAFQHKQQEIKVLSTVASEKKGMDELLNVIDTVYTHAVNNIERKCWLLAEKAYQLISKERMKDIDRNNLYNDIQKLCTDSSFHLYQYIEKYNHSSSNTIC